MCADSDGCAMATMDIKHIRCFGPCMAAEWALAMALTEIDAQHTPIADLKDLQAWAGSGAAQSAGTVELAPMTCTFFVL